MSTVVLVHGAFRGGWSWGRVAARLAVEGYDVHAPDLPGAGGRCRPQDGPVGLEDVLDDLERRFIEADLRDVLLVGHSQGGFVAEALLQRVADRVAVVGHLDAPVPEHGQRAVDLVPPAFVEAMAGQAPPAPDRELWLDPTPLDPDELGVPVLVAGRWTARLTPLSAAIAGEPVALDAPAVAGVAHRFAWCSGTPPTFPAWHTRARREAIGQDDEVLDSPHDAPLARPDLVAQWVRSLG